jgi:hypothetical protein
VQVSGKTGITETAYLVLGQVQVAICMKLPIRDTKQFLLLLGKNEDSYILHGSINVKSFVKTEFLDDLVYLSAFDSETSQSSLWNWM